MDLLFQITHKHWDFQMSIVHFCKILWETNSVGTTLLLTFLKWLLKLFFLEMIFGADLGITLETQCLKMFFTSCFAF